MRLEPRPDPVGRRRGASRASSCATRPPRPGFTSCTAGRHSIRRSPASSRTSPRSAPRSPSPISTATDGPISTSPTAASASPTRSTATAATARSRTSPRAPGSRTSIAPGEGVSMGAVWGDIDNDGREDVLVYRYGYLALFRNVDGRRFEDVTAAAGLHRWVNSNGAIWLDYDRDGLLDLYVTAYFRDIDLWHLATTRIMHNSFEFADQRRKESALPQPRRRQVRGRHRQDGRRQHALDARRRVGRLQRRRLARHLSRQRLRPRGAVPQRPRHGASFSTTAGLESESKSGMSVDAGRRIQPRPARRIRHEHLRARLSLSEQQPAPERDAARRGRFRNVAEGAIADAGWAWGAQFGDLNNDGANELFVANGFISADRDKSYWYAMSKIAGANGALLRGRRDLARLRQREPVRIRALARLPQSRRRRLGGRRRDGRRDGPVRWPRRGARRPLQSRRGGRDRREPEPAGRRCIATIPTAPTTGSPSSSSARAAIAARSAPRWCIESGDLTQRRVIDGGSGFASQNDRRLHFGLGTREWVDRVVDPLAVGHASRCSRALRSIASSRSPSRER